jgi:hypothetical protein
VLKGVAAALAAGGLVWGGLAFASTINATPSCSWPLHARGDGSSAQVGLVRCYIQALANRSAAGLRAVAQDVPAPHITATLFLYSPDARAGVPVATFAANPSDTTDASVAIRFANGVIEYAGILNMDAMGGPSTWRMIIGQPGEPRGQ